MHLPTNLTTGVIPSSVFFPTTVVVVIVVVVAVAAAAVVVVVVAVAVVVVVKHTCSSPQTFSHVVYRRLYVLRCIPDTIFRNIYMYAIPTQAANEQSHYITYSSKCFIDSRRVTAPKVKNITLTFEASASTGSTRNTPPNFAGPEETKASQGCP
eukprot:6463583-Amphidinium_carterae.1